MAKVSVKTTPEFVEKLKSSLKDGLEASGIQADVVTEAVPSTKLHRVKVLAPKFKQLKYTERQNLVWRIADNILSPEEQLRISMIFTLTPDEDEGK